MRLHRCTYNIMRAITPYFKYSKNSLYYGKKECAFIVPRRLKPFQFYPIPTNWPNLLTLWSTLLVSICRHVISMSYSSQKPAERVELGEDYQVEIWGMVTWCISWGRGWTVVTLCWPEICVKHVQLLYRGWMDLIACFSYMAWSHRRTGSNTLSGLCSINDLSITILHGTQVILLSNYVRCEL